MAARILVIEDNLSSLELVTYLLEAFGHRTITAIDGERGIGLARRERPDLVVCDLQLPGVDGYEVARRFGADPDLRQIPLVAVTAYAMVGDREKALAAGFQAYIAKPIDPMTFVGDLEAMLQLAPSLPLLPPSPQAGGERAERANQGKPPPYGAPAEVAAAAVVAASPVASILVLEDSPANLGVLEAILVPCGFRLLLAREIGEALGLARRESPDLIISDLHVWRESGFDFFAAVKADPALRAIPFFFLTASLLGLQERAKALAMGADRFLERPIEPAALVAEIRAVLGRATEAR